MRWLDVWRAGRVRNALEHAMVGEARRAASALPAGMEERVWRGVLDCIGAGEPARASEIEPRRPARKVSWAMSGVSLALAAMIAAYLLVPRPPAQQDGVSDGIKSGSTALDPQLKSLRFALVDAAGQVSPGVDKMRIPPGTPLIFSVEAAHVAAAGHPVVLSYRRDDGPATIVADYRLTADRETLRGPTGYLAFTPDEPGLYRFRLEPRNPSATEPAAHVAFSVEVARP